VLEEKVLPAYYDAPDYWHELVMQGIEGVLPEFTSQRMARQYYRELYQ
jgi:starch phosphorylase